MRKSVYLNDNYEVDEYGIVYNIKRNSVVKPYVGSDNYLHITLYRDGKEQRLRLHTVVYWSFNEKIDGLVIDHINSDKTDSRLCNLRAVSNSENVKKAYDSEQRLSRCNAPLKVYNTETGESFEFLSLRSCAEHFGFNRHNLSNIIKGNKINTYLPYEFTII